MNLGSMFKNDPLVKAISGKSGTKRRKKKKKGIAGMTKAQRATLAREKKKAYNKGRKAARKRRW